MTSERAEPCTAVSTLASYANVTSSLSDVTDNETVTAIGRVWSMPAQPVYVNAVIGIISVLGVLSNSAVLAILLQKKHRKLAANLYLVNLAVGDILVSCSLPVRIIENYGFIEWTPTLCHTYIVFRYLPLFVSVNTIVLIAIERFVAIVLPTRFREFASERSVRLQLAAAWIVAVFELGYPSHCAQVSRFGTTCTVYAHTGLSCLIYMTAILLAVPTTFLLAVYSSIVFVVLSRVRKVQPSVPESYIGNPIAQQQQSNQQHPQPQYVDRRQKRAIRLAVTCAVVTFLFVACWFPVFTIGYLYKLNMIKRTRVLIILTNMLLYFHTSMNPAVYFCFDVRFRSVLVKLFCFKPTEEDGSTVAPTQRSGWGRSTGHGAARHDESVMSVLP